MERNLLLSLLLIKTFRYCRIFRRSGSTKQARKRRIAGFQILNDRCNFLIVRIECLYIGELLQCLILLPKSKVGKTEEILRISIRGVERYGSFKLCGSMRLVVGEVVEISEREVQQEARGFGLNTRLDCSNGRSGILVLHFELHQERKCFREIGALCKCLVEIILRLCHILRDKLNMCEHEKYTRTLRVQA